MDAIRHRAICLNLATHIESVGNGHSVVFQSTVSLCVLGARSLASSSETFLEFLALRLGAFRALGDVETRRVVNCLWWERAPSAGLSLEALMEVVLKYIKAAVVSGSLCLAPQWNHDLCDVWKAVIYFLFPSLTTRGHERVAVWNRAPSLPLLSSSLSYPLAVCLHSEWTLWMASGD